MNSISTWEKVHGFFRYYTLDNDKVQIMPFGKMGPFPTAEQMEDAADKIAAAFPGAAIVAHTCCLDSDLTSEAELASAHAQSLDRLRLMIGQTAR
ncbi:hypothetical protein NA643_15385 [Pseudomonas stutzeri]|uniref:hypothetical protein n=1 Tax=Stutzerimonas stutzeri TaxID=316 RepID=UPI000C99B8C4|nr:hypothetical protein [Stutzerimonas stutzeri]MCQ4280476.1 hypothetical protein [Stutzerimonas stutzeri]PNF71517.1 hypothetical protein CXK96_16905 [Stutzerimonas stutzeri]